MKKFGIGLIVAGVILFLIGVFDIFPIRIGDSYVLFPIRYNRIIYFIWFGIPVALFGIVLTTIALFQEIKIEAQRNLQNK